MKKYKTCYKI